MQPTHFGLERLFALGTFAQYHFPLSHESVTHQVILYNPVKSNNYNLMLKYITRQFIFTKTQNYLKIWPKFSVVHDFWRAFQAIELPQKNIM